MKFKIVEADTAKKFQALADFRKDVAGDCFVTSRKLPPRDKCQCIGGGTRGEGGDTFLFDPNRSGHRIEAVSLTDGTGTGLTLLAVLK